MVAGGGDCTGYPQILVVMHSLYEIHQFFGATVCIVVKVIKKSAQTWDGECSSSK